MASVSQILGFVQAGSASVDGYTVFPAGQSGVDSAFVKLVFGDDLVEYYCFSEAALKVIALSNDVVPSDNTNINRYDSAATPVFQMRYSKDAKGVLQYEDNANIAHYIFYIDPSVADTSIQTFTTDTSRYSSASSFNLTVVNTDGSSETYTKTANTNIIKPQGSTMSVVYDDLGFLQAATNKFVGIDGVMRDVVAAGELVKYIKPSGVVEYYKKGSANGSSVPLFKQVNEDGTDIEGVNTWREYGTPDSITVHSFASDSSYDNGDILVSGGYVAPLENDITVEAIRTFKRESAGVLTEEVSGVKHWYAYTNDAYAYVIANAAVGDKINDIRGTTYKPAPTSGLVYEVRFHAVLYKDATYYAFDGYSTSDINNELFANSSKYEINEYFNIMKARAESDNLSAVEISVKKIADGLINNPAGTSTYDAFSMTGLKNAAAVMKAGESVTKDSISYAFDAVNVLKVGTTYIAYNGVVTESEFAINTKYMIDDVLRQRSLEEADDVVMTKFEVDAVEVVGEEFTTAFSPTGVMKSARKTSTWTTIHYGETVYTRSSVANVLIIGSVYYEYNNLSSLSLREFSTGEYADKSVLKKMSTTDGSELKSYTRIISTVVYDTTEELYYEFNGVDNQPVRASAQAALSDVPKGSIIIDMIDADNNEPEFATAKYYNKYELNLVRIDGNVDWYAYSLAALASVFNLVNATNNKLFVNGHYVTYIATSEKWYYTDYKVLNLNKTQTYLAYDNVVSEEEFATDTKYAVGGKLFSRALNANNDTADIVYDKWADNVVNSSDDLSKTHVYGNLGMCNASKLTDNIRPNMEAAKVHEVSSSITYSYIKQYLLKKDGANEYFEYNALTALTLKDFTVDNTTYPVLSILHKRNVSSGEKVNDYSKVMLSVSNIDEPSNSYYVFSKAAREAAVDENNTTVPSTPASVIYQNINDIVTTYFKVAISTAENQTQNPAFEVGTYHALGQLATGKSDTDAIKFEDGEKVLFTDINTTYIRIKNGLLKEVGTNNYIAYDGAVSQETFATSGDYSTGYTLIQRSTAQTDPDNAVPASDVYLVRFADNAVNKALGSLEPVFEENSYVYGALGRKNAAVSGASKANVISDDGITYTKTAPNILEHSNDIFEYAVLTSKTIKQFVSSSDNAGKKLHKMDTSNGVELAVFDYIEQYVAYAENDNEYYGYSQYIYREVSQNGDIISGSKLIITLTQDNKPSVDDYADRLYYKRATSLVQKGTSNAYIAVALDGFKSAVTGILAEGDNVTVEVGTEDSWGYLKAGTKWYYDAANVVSTTTTDKATSSHTHYLTYSDANSSLTEETFATSSKYAEVTAIYKGDMLVRRAGLDTDSIFTKVFINATQPDNEDVHAFGDLGMLKAAVNTTTSFGFTLINIYDEDKTYYAEKSGILREVATDHYFEYAGLSAITLAEFTNTLATDDRDYSVGRKLYKRSTTDGTAVNVYTKVMDYLSQIDTPENYFYTFSVEARRAAINEDGRIVPIGSTVEQYVTKTTIYVKTSIGGASTDGAFEVSSYVALAGLVTGNADFTNGTEVYFVAEDKTYVKDDINTIVEKGTSHYVTYDQAVSRKTFAISNTKYEATATLRQRAASATSAEADVIYTKVDDNCVDSNEDNSSIAYEDKGLLSAARSSSKSSVKQVVEENASANEDVMLYDILVKNLLKKHGEHIYNEYSGLVDITLKHFSQDTGRTYVNGSTLNKKSTSDGSQLNAFTKVVDSIVYDTDVSVYYSYNGFVYAGDQANATIAVGAKIYDVQSNENEAEAGDIAYIKRYLSLLRRDGTTEWHANTYQALAYASASDSQFVSGHTIQMHNFDATYKYKALAVVEDAAVANSYITFDSALSEQVYAEDDGTNYAAGTLIQRLSSATDAAGDVTITKLATRLVHTTTDSAKTHAYGNIGLRNAAVSDGSKLKATIIDINNSYKAYLYNAQYILQETPANHYYEYNELKTLTLKAFTTLSSDGTRTYSINRKLYGRDKISGEPVVMYEKVIEEITKKDGVNDFWLYSITARDVAINENGSIIPAADSGANRSAIHYIDDSNVETVYYKTRISGVMDQLAAPDDERTPDHIVQTYEALAAIVADSQFKNGETVEFKNNGVSTYYIKFADKLIKQSNTNKYISYGAVTRKTFATGFYVTNATLVQRDASKTIEAEIFASDVTLTKLGDNAVNRKVGTSTDDTVTYVYGEMGRLTAACSPSSKSTVRLVTEDDVASDSSVTDYSKVDANILKLGNKYYEYDNFRSLSISSFASGSYNALDELHKMSITSGSEEFSTYNTPYVKRMHNVVIDSQSYYYVYGGDESGAANAATGIVDIDGVLIKTSLANEPAGSEYMNSFFNKKEIGLLQIGNSNAHNAYCEIGLRSAAVSVLTTSQTVAFSGTTWTYSKANELKTGTSGSATYLTYSDSTPSTVEADFARNAPYVATDALTQRTLSDNTSTAAIATDVSITKLAGKVVNISTDTTYTHTYDDDGLYNAAQLATGVKSKILDVPKNTKYDRVSQYLFKNEAATSTDFYEFNGLDTLNIRAFATGSYAVENKLHKMASSGELNIFTKKYADIAIDGNTGEYYCYVEASLSSVANEFIDVIAVGKFVWEMAEASNNYPSDADTKWTKTERFVLQAAYGSNKKYNVYSLVVGAGIPLNEFACDTAFANGDRLIRKVAPNDVYDRVDKSILHKVGDAANKFYTYYYSTIVLSHLELKQASINNEAVPTGSSLEKMDGTIWTKVSNGILNKNTAYIAFAGSLGPETLATDDATYAIGSTLRLVANNDADSVNYVKNLSGVIYQYQSDEYECYGSNGLKNAAQSENLVENRDAANPYVLRPQLTKIELNAPIVDKAVTPNKYYYKYMQNVLVAVSKSGSQYTVSSPAKLYEFTAASSFGTLSLETLATSATYSVEVTLEDMIHDGAVWVKKHADVILQDSKYYSYSDAGDKWLAYNGTIGNSIEEKSFAALKYTINKNGLLAKDDVSTYYAYSIATDADGLTRNTFSLDASTYPGAVLVDRTSVRVGPTYTRTDAGLLLDDASNYLAFTEAAIQTAAAKTLTESTTVTEDAEGTWSMTGRKVYTWYKANVIKVSSEAAYYVYNLSSLSLNTFATITYAKNDTLVDRSSVLYDGPRYRKVLAEHGVLERKANLAADADAELLTYDGNNILGLRTASLASDIADGKVLVPEDANLGKHLRCAKGLLRLYDTVSTLSSTFKVFQDIAANEADETAEPEATLRVAALRLAAKNLDAAGLALSGDRVVASESSLCVTYAADAAYNTVTINFTKDSGAFVDTLRVGTSAVSDKVTYANVDGTRYNVLKNMCEQDANGSLASSSAAEARYLNKKIYDRSASPVVTYYVLSRGVLRIGGSAADATGNDHVFSDNGLVAAATNSDSMQTFSLHSVSANVESTSTFKRLRKGLLVSAFIIDGVPATDNDTGAAILYYSDYSASAKDDLRNMNYYMYALAKQGAVGGTVYTDADIINGINADTITKLYTIVTKIGGSSKAQQFDVVKESDVRVPNIIRVSDIDGENEYFLAYNETGVTKGVTGTQPYSVVAEALARDGLSNAANSSAVASGSLLYAASSSENNARSKNFEFKKNGAGSMDGPGPLSGAGANNTGSVFTYSAEGIRTFAKLNRQLSTTVPKGVLPKKGSVDGNDTANVYTVWAGKTYYTWEQSVVLAVVGSVQNFEVYDGADVQFARRFAMAEANINAIDYADTQILNRAAYVNGSALVMCGANANTSAEVKTYSKIATGLIKLSSGQHYAFSDYGLAACANLASLPADVIEMQSNEDMVATSSPKWTNKISQLMNLGTVWRCYNALGATVATCKEYFAINGVLADVLNVYSYAAPNTTLLQRTYTIILNNNVTSLIEVNSPPTGESKYQTYGHAGLSLIANDTTTPAFNGDKLKVTEVQMIAIVGDNNSANPGIYKKLQTGAMYKGTNIMLYDDNSYASIMDRFDIVEFDTLDASNPAATRNATLTVVSPSPFRRLYNPFTPPGTAFIDSNATYTISNTTYSVTKILERDFLGTPTVPANSRLSDTGVASVLKNITITNKNSDIQYFQTHTFIEFNDYAN